MADAEAKSESLVVVLHPNDNVAVVARDTAPGETSCGITFVQQIPECHKVARVAISKGEPIRKYAQVIGYASCDIAAGEHVHGHNVEYRPSSEIAKPDQTSDEPQTVIPDGNTNTFMGLRRPSGRVATRNFVGIFSSVNCSATVANRIAAYFDEARLASWPNVDGVVAFTHGTGCGMIPGNESFANLRRTMAGYVNHPNLGASLIVGLGCETNQIASLMQQQGLAESELLQTMNIQDIGGTRATVQAGVEAVSALLDQINKVEREPCPLADLTLALQCGGSDGWSGITANPALGYAADLLVAAGGTAVLAETPEVYGAEHLLLARAANAQTAEKLATCISWWEEHASAHEVEIDANLAPGNRRGGLTTILEKSLGAVAKGGTTQLQDVYRYGEPIGSSGFVFMDSPGYDPVSVTGQIASGCNMVAFTTGRGSAFGSKPAPCIKICSNPKTYANMSEDMDINAGAIAAGDATVAQVGEQILAKLIAVASGEPSASEANGLGDYEFVPWQTGPTM